MKIKEYIKELLFTNQGVVIPGLGGFLTEYEPAAFDVNENKFLPPSKKITFNPEYSYYDSLLVDFISKKEKIDTEESRKILKDFVNDIKHKLDKGVKVEFPEIGQLTQIKKGTIVFEQSKEINLLTDSFGLKSIKAKQTLTEPKPGPVQQKRSYKKPIIFSASALVLILIVITGWYITNGFTDFSIFSSNTEYLAENTNNNIKEITEKNLDSIAEADSLKALIVHTIDDNTDKKDALFYEEPEKQEVKPQYSHFQIIAGSFKRMENAQKFSDELRSKGYNPEIIQSQENLIRISIYSYTDETEALKKLYHLRENSEIKSVWILKSI